MSGERVTLRMIAEEAGVSLNTVSLALRESPRLRATTRARIQALARKLGYTPNPVLSAGMAQLTQRKGAEVGGALVCIHFQDIAELERSAGHRLILKGIHARAKELGYRIERMQIVDEASQRVMLRKMKAMGIAGAVVTGVSWTEVEELLGNVIDFCPVVKVGHRVQSLPIHFSESDHFRGTQLAFRKAVERGSKRVGIVINKPFDQLLCGAHFGGYMVAQQACPPADRIEPLLVGPEPGFSCEEILLEWWRRWQPDAILTAIKSYPLSQWRAWNPTDKTVDFIQLGWTDECPDWPGVSYPGIKVGGAAVDMVVAQIQRGERGHPPFQKCSLVEGMWIE
jgi:DNA-binding LacI/PurR family transcriptional regulator